MRSTIAMTCPDFREIETSAAPGQRARTSAILGVYVISALLSTTTLMTAREQAVRRKQPDTATILVAPLAKSDRGLARKKGHGDISADPQFSGIKIDRNGMKLGIVDDRSFELLKVLDRFHGFIAFAEPDHPRYADAVFDVTGSSATGEASAAIDDYFALLLPDPSQWPKLRTLAEQHGVRNSRIVYVLFPLEFWEVVSNAIRRQAQKQTMSGRITEAVIRFDARIPAGIDVENVTALP